MLQNGDLPDQQIASSETEQSTLPETLVKILHQHLIQYQDTVDNREFGFGLYLKGPANTEYQNLYVAAGFPQEYGARIHFRGASTTKTFTAAAILLLHQQGKLDIDDLITATIPGKNEPYIPATEVYAIPFKERITIRLLLQHRAGVFDVTNTNIPATVDAPYAGKRYFDYVESQQGEDHTFTFSELIGVVSKHQLSYFEPGTDFHYSNTGCNLLATIIERISGSRYHEFLQESFLTPLQMVDTTFPYLGTDKELPEPNVPGWLKFNGQVKKLDDDNVSFAVSEGNIITTPADLATWAHALYATNSVLNSALQLQMTTGIPTNEVHVSYGMGCERDPADLGWGHNGARPAYVTVMRYHPVPDTSFVIFCNFLDTGNLLQQSEAMNNILREAIRAIKELS